MSLTERLKEARLEADMTQEQAAVRARIARYSVQRYETGIREPSASALKSLADVYGKNLDWFWGDQEENSDPQESQLPTQDVTVQT